MEALDSLRFHKEILFQTSRRKDGRSVEDKREIHITKRCFTDGQSSSMIAIGHTIVATKIMATPQPISPSFTVQITRSAVSLESGKNQIDQTISAFMTVLVNRFLSMSELEIARPDPHNPFHSNVKVWGWKLDICQSILSDDGGVEVACVLGIQNALAAMDLPNYNLDDEAKLVENGTFHKLSLISLFAANFSIIEEDEVEGEDKDLKEFVVVDPTKEEERISEGTCSIVLSNEERPKILAMNTTGKFELTPERVNYMISKASL